MAHNSVLQAGFLVTMAMLVLAYIVVVLTVLSVSAIATSGSVQAGGVYCILTLYVYYMCMCV